MYFFTAGTWITDSMYSHIDIYQTCLKYESHLCPYGCDYQMDEAKRLNKSPQSRDIKVLGLKNTELRHAVMLSRV